MATTDDMNTCTSCENVENHDIGVTLSPNSTRIASVLDPMNEDPDTEPDQNTIQTRNDPEQPSDSCQPLHWRDLAVNTPHDTSYNRTDHTNNEITYDSSNETTQNTSNERTPLMDHSSDSSSSSSSTMSIEIAKVEVSTIVYILVILFGLSSWIDINGLWVEIPLLVNSLPEKWNLPSYLVIIIQVANIGPLIYMIGNHIAPQRVREWPVVYIIVSIGATACILLAFFWSHTSYIGQNLHSTALITLTGFLALVDCTSSVVYLPYMAQFKPQYMTAYYIGEGLSGLLPGLVGLIQGVGSEPRCVNETIFINDTMEHRIIPIYSPPRFGVEGFFFFLFAMMCVSGVSFTIIHYSKFCRKEHVIIHSRRVRVHKSKKDIKEYSNDDQLDCNGDIDDTNLGDLESTRSLTSSHPAAPVMRRLSVTQYITLLILTAWINALMNGILPSIQSYSCLPYGNLAYTLAVRLSTVANPLMCFLALFLTTKSLKIVWLLTLIGTALAAYQLYLAVMSPSPPLEGTTAGIILVIVSQVLLSSCISYIKVINASIFNNHGGSKALLWCGAVTQIGSCVGAIVIFILVNKLHIFEAEQPCS